MGMAMMIFEAVVLAATVSLDAFLASFAYGSNRIQIPFSSGMVINLVCSGILGISLLFGSLVRPYLAPGLSTGICFVILLAIGLVKLLDTLTKSLIRKHGDITKDIRFSMLNFKFVLSVYADPEKADVDCSKSISYAEAVSLAVALSLDGMAVGFGAALGQVNGLVVFLCSLVTGAVAVFLGAYLGNKAARLRHNFSWLSGAILIALAIGKLA